MLENFRLSVSKTKSFNLCRRQYQFNYILKFPKKLRDYHTLGKFCHACLEEFHKAYLEGSLLPHNVVMSQAWKIAWNEFKADMTPPMKKECWDIINLYIKKIATNKKLLENVIAVEKRFELPITENITLNGAIDIIRMDDYGTVEVSDYKSTKNKSYLANDWFQLMTYGLVMLSEFPDLKVIKGSYILLRHDYESIDKEFTIAEILDMKQKYLDYANQMMAEQEFKATPNSLCNWCDHLDSCEEGRTKVANNSFFDKTVYGEVGYGN